MSFEVPESSLPVVNGKIYHLAIGPEQLADYVIIVGDPDRVPIIAKKFFVSIDTDVYHRGLRTITGTTAAGVRMTATTSGMGTPSLEIVLNELIALKKIDLATRTPLPTEGYKPLTIIRVGTSGAVRSGTALGTCIIAKYSVGLDNAAIFLDVPAADDAVSAIEKKVTDALHAGARPDARFINHIHPYAAKANPEVVQALVDAAVEKGSLHKVGITASAAGFFANQGRQLLEGSRLTVPNVDSVVGSVDFSDVEAAKDLNIENLEMETATLFHIGYGAGFRCGAVCVTVAQRRTGEFLCNQAEAVERCIQCAVDALEKVAANDKA